MRRRRTVSSPFSTRVTFVAPWQRGQRMALIFGSSLPGPVAEGMLAQSCLPGMPDAISFIAQPRKIRLAHPTGVSLMSQPSRSAARLRDRNSAPAQCSWPRAITRSWGVIRHPEPPRGSSSRSAQPLVTQTSMRVCSLPDGMSSDGVSSMRAKRSSLLARDSRCTVIRIFAIRADHRSGPTRGSSPSTGARIQSGHASDLGSSCLALGTGSPSRLPLRTLGSFSHYHRSAVCAW